MLSTTYLFLGMASLQQYFSTLNKTNLALTAQRKLEVVTKFLCCIYSSSIYFLQQQIPFPLKLLLLRAGQEFSHFFLLLWSLKPPLPSIEKIVFGTSIFSYESNPLDDYNPFRLQKSSISALLRSWLWNGFQQIFASKSEKLFW